MRRAVLSSSSMRAPALRGGTDGCSGAHRLQHQGQPDDAAAVDAAGRHDRARAARGRQEGQGQGRQAHGQRGAPSRSRSSSLVVAGRIVLTLEPARTPSLFPSQAFAQALHQVTPHLAREQGFISDFLHINPLDASITFADYMSLETFFRRGATSYLAQQAQKGQLRDIRSAMEVVFGFLEGEMRDWIDGVLQKDSACVGRPLSPPLCPTRRMCEPELTTDRSSSTQSDCRHPRRPRPVRAPHRRGQQRVLQARPPEAVPAVPPHPRAVLRASSSFSSLLLHPSMS